MKYIVNQKLFDLHMRATKQAIANYKCYMKIAVNHSNFKDFAEDFLHQAEEQLLMAELYLHIGE